MLLERLLATTTIRNILSRHGITNWRAKKRPELTEEVAAKRLSWCFERKDWKWDKWQLYMFSDECPAERGRGKVGVWVFGTPEQKWDPARVSTYQKVEGYISDGLGMLLERWEVGIIYP